MEYEIVKLRGDAGRLISQSGASSSNISFLLLTSVFRCREPY